jgi:peptidoglycan/LPS O-acetylase OafA/YrhL
LKNSGYIPSLNGVRAGAVLIVFVGHGLTVPPAWPGHVGVTIFFFMSGFLITTLLRREYLDSGRISLGSFYLRRAFRILPPAYATIGIAVVVGAIGLLPSSTTVGGVLAEVFNFTNYYLIVVGREGLPPETSMLWSLAVEEHFYLIFPLLMIVLLKRKLSMRQIGYILLMAVVLAPVWRIYLALNGAEFYHLYTGSDTRFDGILAGAAMALLYNPTMGDSPPFRLTDWAIHRVLLPIALFLFAASTLATADAIRLTVIDTVQFLCLAVFFWHVITRPLALIGRILNHRWVAHIGVLSFSIYLIHRLVIAIVARFIDVAPITDIVSLVGTVACAQLMYVAIEKPFARARKSVDRRLSSNSERVDRRGS